MPWIDFKHIKASVSFIDVLAYYAIELKQTSSGHFTGECPLPDHAGDRSNHSAFHVDTEKRAFNCFTHCDGGNIIDFVARMERVEFRKAAELLQERFLSDSTVNQTNQNQDAEDIKTEGDRGVANKPLTFQLKGLKHEHPLLLKEKGLTIETVKAFGLGFCSKGLLAGWIAIPIHNRVGELVAYIGRAVNSTQAETYGKYKIPSGFKKSLEVFNLNRATKHKDFIKKYGLIIVEGFFGVFWLRQCGYKNVVALMGKELSDTQIKTLQSITDRFTIFLDGDEPGQLASRKVTGKLINSSFVRVIHYQSGPKRKPAHFEKEELKTLLSIHTPSS